MRHKYYLYVKNTGVNTDKESGFGFEAVKSDLSTQLTVLSKFWTYIYLLVTRENQAVKINPTQNFCNKAEQHSSIHGFLQFHLINKLQILKSKVSPFSTVELL